MNPRILGRRAGDGPRHARAQRTRSGDRRADRTPGPHRYRRRVAVLVSLWVLPTAATLTDMADHPLAAHESPSLENASQDSTGSSDTVQGRLVSTAIENLSSTQTLPPTVHITAAAGETIWSVADRSGVAPGAVLRHNRPATSEPPGGVGGDANDDALASGRALERAETLVVPLSASRTDTSGTGTAGPERAHPVVDSPELAALESVFDRWADHFGVPRDLLKALAWVESGWDNDTRSPGGGIGIGRIQPMRAQYLAEHVAEMDLDPTVEVDNIALTAAQLRVLLDETPDVPSAVAAHRQGITDTRLSGIDPLLDGYVEAILTVRLRFA